MVTSDSSENAGPKTANPDAIPCSAAGGDSNILDDLIQCELQKLRHCKSVEQLTFGENSLTELEKEALLVCFLFQSGYMRQAYEYGKSRMDEFEKTLPLHLASIISLYFARLCDWNSQYDSFLRFTSVAGALALEMSDVNQYHQKLLVQCGAECLSIRAMSMCFGPVMKWPDKHFNFRLSLGQIFTLYCRSAFGSFRLRRLIARFKNDSSAQTSYRFFPKAPGSTARSEELIAWQYYLDHRQVFLNYLIRFLSMPVDINPRRRFIEKLVIPIKKIATVCARMALWNLTRLSRQAGAATIQADVYLFRARYGVADDLALAEHLWSLVNNPVGGALVLRDRGARALKAVIASPSVKPNGQKIMEARRQFLRCYALSTACGSHLTALKALIGLFLTGYPFRRSIWQKHLDGIQGQRHVSFFKDLTDHIAKNHGFRSPRSKPL